MQVISIVALCLAALVSVSNGLPVTRVVPVCTPANDGKELLCKGGSWPSTADPALTFLPTLEKITLEDVSVSANDLQPFPATLVNLAKLTFSKVTSRDLLASTVLPLQQLTASIAKAKITELELDAVTIFEMEEAFLAGFSGLKTLSVTASEVRAVQPDALKPLQVTTPGAEGTPETVGSNLVLLVFNENRGIKAFPWEVLAPVSNSIESVELKNNNDLTKVTFASNPEAGSFTLPQLTKLNVNNNPALSTLPANVLALIGANSAATTSTSVEFLDNGNQCQQCGLKSLVTWAKAKPATAGPRDLKVSCRRDCLENPVGTVESPSGMDQWELIPACGTEALKTCTAAYEEEAQKICKPSAAGSEGKAFVCEGRWPQYLTPSFPATTESITFRNISFNGDAIRALSAGLTSLVQLDFDLVTSSDTAGKRVPLPLQKLTELLDRSKIRVIQLNEVELGELNKDFLVGFTGLTTLSITSSAITAVSADVFTPLLVEEVAGTPEAATKRSVLTFFTFNSIKGVISFPWAVLSTVATSIQVVEIHDNQGLSDIALPTSTVAPLSKLTKLTIKNNNALTTVSTAVMATIIAGEASSPAAYIEFINNGNQCDGCGLLPLIKWAQNAVVPAVSRSLKVSCRLNCTKNGQGEGENSGVPFGMGSVFWIAYPDPALTCKPTVVQSCQAAFDEANPVRTTVPIISRPTNAPEVDPTSAPPANQTTESTVRGGSTRSATSQTTAGMLVLSAVFIFFARSF
ncbi:hypothetical protein BV898_10447 [Hypsibius exemplaris]|uniref:Uncharacterized protein n=1 Tax=Hypsibius exemplaris TaxID=2072580 RepID=A0A1W0WJE4_HYPEX|nr:hypothetical protein BV898_10447 [Hypsibius exemplaris]